MNIKKRIKKEITHIKLEEKNDFIKKLLNLLIYPIKIPDKELELERFKIDLLKSPRNQIKNWNVPNGLYINKICNAFIQNQLINEFNDFFLHL